MESKNAKLMSNIKTEPLEYVEEPQMGEEQAGLINISRMEQLVVDPEDLGVLGDMLKGYDSLKSKSGTIEFLLGNSGHSFVVSVKKLEHSAKPIDQSRGKTNNMIASCQEFKSSQKQVQFEAISKNEIKTDDEESVEEQIEIPESNDNNLIVEDINNIHNYFKANVEDCDDDNEIDETVLEEIVMMSDDDEDGYEYLMEKGDSDGDLSSDVLESGKMYTCSHCKFMTSRRGVLFEHLMGKHTEDVVIKEEKDEVENSDDEISGDCNSAEETIAAVSDTVKKKRKPVKQTKRRKTTGRQTLRKIKSEEETDSNFTDFVNVNDDYSPDSKYITKKIKSELYQCSLCDFSCQDQTQYYRHIGLVHANTQTTAEAAQSALTKCELCDYKGKNRRRLTAHMRITHKLGPKLHCKQCDYVTAHSANFNRHVEIVHEKRKTVQCDQCDFITSRKYLLEKHVMYKHQGIKPYQCPECDFGSTSSSTCKAHITEVHRGERPYKCPENGCNYATSRRFIFRNHMRSSHKKDMLGNSVHDLPTGKRDFTFACPYCKHVATQKGNLARHIKIKHTNDRERYKCGECDFTSSQKYYVEIHITEVHKGEYPYSCNLCDFKSSVKQRYERHFQAVHLGQKPHQCQFCDYKSSQKVHLNRHIEVVHMGEKPHVCIYCEFQTAHRGNLKAHLKGVHKVQPEILLHVLRECKDLRKANDIVIIAQSKSEIEENKEDIAVEEDQQQYNEDLKLNEQLNQIEH